MDLQNLVLRPNCLLTKSPLVFIPGPRSLFFYKKPFGFLPEFLFEHGYRAEVTSLPFRGELIRRRAFTLWLNRQAEPRFHFILDHITYQELKDIIPTECTASLTVLGESWQPPERTPPTLAYNLHRLFSFVFGRRTPVFSNTFSKFNKTNYDRFLDHCVKLAENEIYA